MSKILNTILTTFFVFFACFCWVYYLTKLGDTALLGASVLAVAAACLCATKKPAKKTTNKKIAKQLALQFALYGDNGVIEQLYQFDGYTTKKVSCGFVATKQENSTLVCVEFGTKNSSCDKVIVCAKTAFDNGCNNLAFWCKGVDGELAKYIHLLPVKCTVYDAKSTVQLLSKYHMLPTPKITKQVSNTPVLNYALNKKRAKSYFVSSTFSFGLAFLSYFPLYNLVWGSVFALVGVYAAINKKFNLEQQNLHL